MLRLCERFGCLPHELLAAPAEPLMTYLKLEALARGNGEGEGVM